MGFGSMYQRFDAVNGSEHIAYKNWCHFSFYYILRYTIVLAGLFEVVPTAPYLYAAHMGKRFHQTLSKMNHVDLLTHVDDSPHVVLNVVRFYPIRVLDGLQMLKKRLSVCD